MPVSEYYKGSGSKVMRSMKKTYGPETGKRVFYATANKQGMKPSGDEMPQPISREARDEGRERMHRALDRIIDECAGKGMDASLPKRDFNRGLTRAMAELTAIEQKIQASPPSSSKAPLYARRDQLKDAIRNAMGRGGDEGY